MSTSDLKFFDTVCGMELDAASAKYAHEHKGEIYYFCSAMCRKHFIDNPERYCVDIEQGARE